MRFRSVLALIVVLLSSPLFASEKARAFRVRVDGESLRVVVPKTFEPLLPGSVYPNRRKPVEARRLPVAILDREAAPALEFLLERKFLVVERRNASPRNILAALASRPEADTEHAVLVAYRRLPLDIERIRALEILDPDAGDMPLSAPPDTPVAFFLRMPEREPSQAFSSALAQRFGPLAAEKWYRSEKGFPEQAYRDAAEWAAMTVAR